MRTAENPFTTSIEGVPTPNPLGSNYASGDAIGQRWVFPSCVRSNGSYWLVDLTIIDPTNTKIAIDILLFQGLLALQTDSGAPTLSLFDGGCNALAQITSSDTWTTVGAEAMITKTGINICRKIDQAELYFLPIARGSLNTTRLRIVGGFMID